jgi:hypothetical protein
MLKNSAKGREVSGHDFSRADEGVKLSGALAPEERLETSCNCHLGIDLRVFSRNGVV